MTQAWSFYGINYYSFLFFVEWNSRGCTPFHFLFIIFGRSYFWLTLWEFNLLYAMCKHDVVTSECLASAPTGETLSKSPILEVIRLLRTLGVLRSDTIWLTWLGTPLGNPRKLDRLIGRRTDFVSWRQWFDRILRHQRRSTQSCSHNLQIQTSKTQAREGQHEHDYVHNEPIYWRTQGLPCRQPGCVEWAEEAGLRDDVSWVAQPLDHYLLFASSIL